SIHSRVAFLAGFEPEIYNCCPNSCVCYVGAHEKWMECPFCQEPWYHADGKAHKKFTYIPLIPCLRAFAMNQKMAESMQYHAKGHQHKPGQVEDVFDGTVYCQLLRQLVQVGEWIYHYRYFGDWRDIALCLSTDGFGPFKHHKHT
ncbi:uncharacterized protein EV420DRAFT_1235924, partial [Desarmillaria tabescens]